MDMLPKQQMQSGSGGPKTGAMMSLQSRLAAAAAESRANEAALRAVADGRLAQSAAQNDSRPTSYVKQ